MQLMFLSACTALTVLLGLTLLLFAETAGEIVIAALIGIVAIAVMWAWLVLTGTG